MAIASYVGMVILSLSDYDSFYSDIRTIHYSLYRAETDNSRTLLSMQTGIEELIEKTDLKIKKGKTKGSYICDTDLFRPKVQEGRFINVDTSEIYTIYSSTFKMKHNLLRYYLFVLTTILHNKEIYLSESDKKSNCIGYMYQRVIREKLNISKSTQLTYNDILQNDLKLLYMTDYELTYRKKDGTFGSAPSIYSRYEDRNYVDAYVKQTYPQPVEAHKKASRSYHRSMIMKYNAICKGKQYEKKILQEVKEYVTKYNEQIYQLIQNFEDNGQKSQADNERKKIKDLTVLKKYLYK